MPQFPIACVALVSVLVMAAPPSAAGQGAPPAVCPECPPLAVQIADLEAKWEEAQKLFYQELGESMALMRENANDRVEISQIQRTASPEVAAKLIKEIEARIAAREPAIKEHSDRATHHSRQAAAIRTEIARLAGELERCNLRCQTPAGTPPPPPTGTGGGKPPAPPPLPPDDTPVPVRECPACKDLATRLNNLLQQRRAARGTLETVVNSRGAWEEEIAEREAELKKLQAGRQNNRADDREVAVEDRLEFAREQLQESEKYREFWEGEIKRLDAEIAPLQSEFERCDKACKPTTETGSLFSQPKWSGTGRVAVGRSTWVGAGEKQCADIMAAGAQRGFMTTCARDDGGRAVAFGADARFKLNSDLDVALMARALNAAAATVDATQSVGNTERESGFTTTARVIGMTLVLGHYLMENLRIYAGPGWAHVSADVTGDHRATLNGSIETVSDLQELSASGPHLRGGAEVYLTSRIGIYGEGARFWFKGGEFKPLSQLVGGVIILLGPW